MVIKCHFHNPRDLQAKGAQQVEQALSDPQEDQDLRDHLELQERRECL